MPGTYPVIGEVTAGRIPDFTVREGAVSRITTGAAVPEGADAVIKVKKFPMLSSSLSYH